MEKSTVGILIGVFIVALIGVIAVSIIASNVQDNTQLTTATESISLKPVIVNATWYNGTRLSLGANTIQSGFRTDYAECEVTSLYSLTNYTGTAKTTPLKYNFTEASGGSSAYITIAGAADVHRPRRREPVH